MFALTITLLVSELSQIRPECAPLSLQEQMDSLAKKVVDSVLSSYFTGAENHLDSVQLFRINFCH